MFKNLPVSQAFSNQISSALKHSRLSHALILEGASEDIRLKAAKEIAKALVCKSADRPCGVCNACSKAETDIHPDIHILKKNSDSTMIKVDEIRDIRSKAVILPNESEKSVFIIAEAQNMNPQSQNALLKILEEPKSHVCFILTCPSKSSLLTTVISRATAYSVGQEISKDDNEKVQNAKSTANELLLSFAFENELTFMKKTAVFNKDKQLFSLSLKSMLPIVRDCVTYQNGGRDFISDFPETSKKLAGVLTAKKAMKLYEKVSELFESTEGFANHNLTLTRFPAMLYDIKTQ